MTRITWLDVKALGQSVHHRLTQFFWISPPPAAEQLARIRVMERDIGLPVRAVVLGILVAYFFFSNWFKDIATGSGVAVSLPMTPGPREVLLEPIRTVFLGYLGLSVAAAFLLAGMDRVPLRILQWAAAALGLLDGLFLSGLTLVTGVLDSVLFWVFPGLLVRNAISIPSALAQAGLNILVSLSFLWAGLLDLTVTRLEIETTDDPEVQAIAAVGMQFLTEPFLLRVVLLLLLTFCCYGVQVLLDRQRRAAQEAAEFSQRQAQLQATGRLAAEIAHQLKNPLGIINNAAFNLQRAAKDLNGAFTQQVRIIREEVERSDRIITELMGYAQLVEGRVERLDVIAELDLAITRVFPPGAKFAVEVERDYAPVLPPLLMQRSHLSEIFTNLLQNAREAMSGVGKVRVSAHCGDDSATVVAVEDNGPGVDPADVPKIFEPYFTTKPRGTGLGLSIVKHNTEIYGGTVKLESALGKGSRFILEFPSNMFMRSRR